MNETLVYAMFAAAVVLPGLPSLAELRGRSDAAPLQIDPDYAMDPRYLGKSFRRKIARLVAEWRTGTEAAFLSRENERARIVDALAIGSGSHVDEAILCTGDVRTGASVQMTDLYSSGSVRAGEGSRFRTVTADGSIALAENTCIARWADAERDLGIGQDSTIGHSASAGGVCRVGSRVRFSRLFGRPVVVGQEPRDPGTPPAYESDKISAQPLVVDARETVAGSIKCEHDVTIGAGARIAGSIVARGEVRIEDGASVFGHVFSESNIRIGANAVVGAPGSSKTVYASRNLTIAPGATVYGWIICEAEGTTI